MWSEIGRSLRQRNFLGTNILAKQGVTHQFAFKSQQKNPLHGCFGKMTLSLYLKLTKGICASEYLRAFVDRETYEDHIIIQCGHRIRRRISSPINRDIDRS